MKREVNESGSFSFLAKKRVFLAASFFSSFYFRSCFYSLFSSSFFLAAFSFFLFLLVVSEKISKLFYFSSSSRFLIGRAARARVAAIFPRVQVPWLLAQLDNVAGSAAHAAHHIWGDFDAFTCSQLLVVIAFFLVFL